MQNDRRRRGWKNGDKNDKRSKKHVTVNFVYRSSGLQATLDKVHLVLARPVRIGPDVAKGFPNVPVRKC
jgi:hypothetical protein